MRSHEMGMGVGLTGPNMEFTHLMVVIEDWSDLSSGIIPHLGELAYSMLIWSSLAGHHSFTWIRLVQPGLTWASLA